MNNTLAKTHPRIFRAKNDNLICLPENSSICSIASFFNLVPTDVICLRGISWYPKGIQSSTDNPQTWRCISLTGWNTVMLNADCSNANIVVGGGASAMPKVTEDGCIVRFDISEAEHDINLILVLLLFILCLLCCFCFCIAAIIAHRIYTKYRKTS